MRPAGVGVTGTAAAAFGRGALVGALVGESCGDGGIAGACGNAVD